jgi:hypothetical protein
MVGEDGDDLSHEQPDDAVESDDAEEAAATETAAAAGSRGARRGIVIIAAALVVILAVGVAAALIVRDSGSHTLHATIQAKGACSSAPKMQVFVVDSAGGSSPANGLKFDPSGSGCNLVFTAGLQKADWYRVHITISAAGIGSATLSSPQYSSSQLAADNYTLVMNGNDFTMGSVTPGSGGPTPVYPSSVPVTPTPLHSAGASPTG